MKKIISFSLFFLFLYGCEETQQLAGRMPFPENEYKSLATTGTATVKGQAFLKTRGGDVKVAAGNEVILNPVTSYSNEWYQIFYLQHTPMEQPDERLWLYAKKTIADGDGRFTFKNVPAGDYYVTTGVFWETPTGYQATMQWQGGVVTKKITIKDSEEIEVILTR